MKSQYEKIVRLICGDNWETNEVPIDEKDGGYGVAICLACLHGSSAKLSELSDFTGVTINLLEIAYKRLQINGIFSYGSAILNDEDLMMSKANTEQEMDRCIRAWCHIAGIASGYIGKGGLRSEMISHKKVK